MLSPSRLVQGKCQPPRRARHPAFDADLRGKATEPQSVESALAAPIASARCQCGSAGTLASVTRDHEIRAGRQAALLALAARLPAPILAERIGIHQARAAQWVRAAGATYPDYVALRTAPSPRPVESSCEQATGVAATRRAPASRRKRKRVER